MAEWCEEPNYKEIYKWNDLEKRIEFDRALQARQESYEQGPQAWSLGGDVRVERLVRDETFKVMWSEVRAQRDAALAECARWRRMYEEQCLLNARLQKELEKAK